MPSLGLGVAASSYVPPTISVEYLALAGGGAGGGGQGSTPGAGGGAGGFRDGTLASTPFSSPISITIGSGGVGISIGVVMVLPLASTVVMVCLYQRSMRAFLIGCFFLVFVGI